MSFTSAVETTLSERTSEFRFTPRGLEIPVSEIDHLSRVPHSKKVMMRTKGNLLFLIPESIYSNGGKSAVLLGVNPDNLCREDEDGLRVYDLKASGRCLTENVIEKLSDIEHVFVAEREFALNMQKRLGISNSELVPSLDFELNPNDLRNKTFEIAYEDYSMFVVGDYLVTIPRSEYVVVREGGFRIFIQNWKQLVESDQVTIQPVTES